MKQLILCIALLAITAPASALDPVTVATAGVVAKDVVSKLNDALSGRIGQAVAGGDFLLEKNYRQLQLLLSNADVVFKDNIGLTFDKLSEHEQLYIRTIESLTNKLDGMQNRILDLESFAAMDLNSVLGVLPGIDGNKFLLRRIEGFSQTYKDSGTYTIRLTGQAFTPDRRVSITLNGQPVDIRPLSQTYIAIAEIPVSLINDQFDNRSVKRVKIDLKSWTKNKAFFGIFGEEEKLDFDYTTELLLLPKFPVTYEFMEVRKGQGWSEKLSSISGQAIATRTGESGKWNRYLVSATIPKGALMVQNSAKSWIAAGIGAGSWGNWEGDIQFTNNSDNGPTTVSRSFAHQIHDQDRTLAIEVSYRVPVPTFGRVPVVLHDPISTSNQPLQLPFDKLYEAILSPEYITYYIRLKYFNGEEISIQEGQSPGNGIEIRSINKGGYNAVTMKITNPYERVSM
ncbi:hypothetical protein [Nitrosomonas sp.]|uniref:hypothetical protein n=1 Tax=Nitrosomonas sp. TaxID=42353 RepID=UPI0035AF0DB5